MTHTVMRQQINQRIQSMPEDQLTVVWELVMHVDEVMQKLMSKDSARAVFEVDAFLAWRERQREQELMLETQRLNRLEQAWRNL